MMKNDKYPDRDKLVEWVSLQTFNRVSERVSAIRAAELYDSQTGYSSDEVIIKQNRPFLDNKERSVFAQIWFKAEVDGDVKLQLVKGRMGEIFDYMYLDEPDSAEITSYEKYVPEARLQIRPNISFGEVVELVFEARALSTEMLSNPIRNSALKFARARDLSVVENRIYDLASIRFEAKDAFSYFADDVSNIDNAGIIHSGMNVYIVDAYESEESGNMLPELCVVIPDNMKDKQTELRNHADDLKTLIDAILLFYKEQKYKYRVVPSSQESYENFVLRYVTNGNNTTSVTINDEKPSDARLMSDLLRESFHYKLYSYAQIKQQLRSKEDGQTD